MIQCAWLLRAMAEITGHKAGKVFHKIVNAHIYEDQIEGIKEQITRTPYRSPILEISPEIGSLNYLENNLDISRDHNLVNYMHQEPIKFPFTV